MNFKFLWTNGVSKKIKGHLPQHPSALQQLISPHLFNFFKKILAHPHLKKRAETMQCIWEIAMGA